MSTHTAPHPSTQGHRTSASATPDVVRPGTAGYWVGALIAVLTTLSALGWGAFTFLGWQAHVADFPRVIPPDSATVVVTEPGSRVVYAEHDRSTIVSSLPTVTVRGPSGSEEPVTAYGADLRYDVPDDARRVGDAVLMFHADEPGTYRIVATAADPGVTLAIGDDLIRGWAPQIIGAVGLLLGGLLLGLVAVIVTAARRARTTS